MRNAEVGMRKCKCKMNTLIIPGIFNFSLYILHLNLRGITLGACRFGILLFIGICIGGNGAFDSLEGIPLQDGFGQAIADFGVFGL